MLNAAVFFCFLVLLAIGFPLWLKIAVRKRAGVPAMESRPSPGSPLGFIDIIVVFFFWIFGQMAAVGVAGMVLGIDVQELDQASGDQKAWFSIWIGVGHLFSLALAAVYLLVRYRRLEAIGIQRRGFFRDIGIGLVAFPMVLPIIFGVHWILVQVIEYQHSTLEDLQQNPNALTILASWFGAVLVASVFEEFLFRGILQGWLQRLKPGFFTSDQVLSGGWEDGKVDRARLPTHIDDSIVGSETVSPKKVGQTDSVPYWPILVTSVLFGLAHFGQGPAPISLFFFGLALGYLYRKTNSLIPCIVLHMCFNGFTMFWTTIGLLFPELNTST